MLYPILLNISLLGLAHELPNSIDASIYEDKVFISLSERTGVQLNTRLPRALNVINTNLKRCGLRVSADK